MLQLLYRIIYNESINPFLLRLNKILSTLIFFRLPPSGIIKVDAEVDKIFLMATNQTSYVTKLLFWNGSAEFEYTTIYKRLILNCNTFIDVGANTGYYSLLGATINQSLKVFAFEPATGPLFYLKRNIELNRLKDKITVSETALSNISGNVDFYEVKNKKYKYLKYNLGGVGSLTEDQDKAKYTVTTLTLDEFVHTNNIISLDLIKLDTEGTENLILEGGQTTITRFKPIIICETLYNKIENKLERIMLDHGYLLFNHIKKGKLEQVKSLKRSVDNGVRDCFFIHPTKVYLIESFL